MKRRAMVRRLATVCGDAVCVGAVVLFILAITGHLATRVFVAAGIFGAIITALFVASRFAGGAR